MLPSAPGLALRPLRAEDAPAFVAMHADPVMTASLGGPIPSAAARTLLDRLIPAGAAFAADPAAPPAPFAVEEDGRLAGLVGLSPIRAPVPLTGVEVLWRLAPHARGRGIATRAARAWIDHGFAALGLTEILAFTAQGNLASRAVMARLGLRHDPARDFRHPALAPDHPLAPHVVFCMQAYSWHEGRA